MTYAATITTADLSAILASHALWAHGKGGKRAYLSGAYLSGAYLRGAYLNDAIKASGAPHRRATRADGYDFLLWHTDVGWRIVAGCRFFTPDEARAHWAKTRPTSTPLGAETDDILAFFEACMRRHDAKQEKAA